MSSRTHTGSGLAVVPAAGFGVAIAVVVCVAALLVPTFARGAARHATPRAMPSTITLSSEAPHQVTAMGFTLNAPAKVRAVVLRDGTLARTLRSGTMRIGRHRVIWDGTGDQGIVVSAGTYSFEVTIRRSGRRAIVYRSAVTVAAQRPPASLTASLAWPVDGVVSSPFGPRGTRNHDGIDISAAAGTPIVATAAGRVVSAGDTQGYGLTVVIEHDGTGMRTLYAHQSRLVATKDQVITAGQVIGYVGHTGDADGDHLHFEVRGPDGIAVDPQPLLPSRDA